MSNKNNESLLWQKVKKGLVDCFLTRIESSTINGIPDIHGVHKSGVFWIELKSDKSKFPKLNKWQIVWINRYIKAGGIVFILHENLDNPLSKRRIKLYRPVSGFTDPRSLIPEASFLVTGQWPRIQEEMVNLLLREQRGSRSRLLDNGQVSVNALRMAGPAA
jgi:hypothetical protein